MQDFGGHPPFAHNPHVYDGVDPAGNPTTAMVVHSHAMVGEEGPELVDLPAATVVSRAGDPSTESDDADIDVDGDGQVTGYEVFTKVDLIAHIEGLNKNRPEDDQLSTSGNKPDLVRRIQEAEAESGGE